MRDFLTTTIALGLLGCAALAAAATPLPSVDRVCVVDNLRYTSIQAAVADCGSSGLVVIPPTYSGTESEGAGANAMDLRHPESVRGLTPVTEFGAKGDAASGADGASDSGSATFRSGKATFVRGRDEGKAIVITGAGPENATLITTISTVDSPNRVTLGTHASFTATKLTYWYGTENTAAMEAAYRSRKPLFLAPGKYLMTGTVKGSTPLFLTGAGQQSLIIDDTAVFDVHGKQGHYLDNFRMQAATKLTPVRPDRFPTPHSGTPVTVDRIGRGIGYQPEPGDEDIWDKVSAQQKAQQIGPTLTLSGDGTHIYRITGDLISIILFEVQFSEVALCDFSAGKNFVGGIALWHTPKDGLANKEDSIHDNTVRYSSFSGIAWAAADKISVRHNVVEYCGESGLKNYSTQGDGTFNTNIEVVANHSAHNHYDGMDLSESYPHSNSQKASSIASGNVSSFNDRTGAFGDGIGWKLVNNTFENNGLTGLSVDVSESEISGNILRHNNYRHDPTANQMIVGPSHASVNNIIERNQIEGDAASGAAIKVSPSCTGNQLRDNTATGGAVFRFVTPPSVAQRNSDSRGRYPDR